ncbi:MAG: glucose 1-dehydrogenase [Parvibaculum sp.]|uniref:glucose 1-dehydrogenase n=1 Tax=Parvibaculum sp. TaxID=2024848 RepID=UPI003263199A
MGRVEGKAAIVTGGASGIGEACAKLLAREGARVAVSDIDRDGGARVAKEIEEAGGTARFLEHDVTSEIRWQEVVAQTVAAFGGLHILVNNAGIGVGGLCENFSLEDWRRQTAINVDGVFLGTKHAIPAMRASGNGSIVIMSSGAGLSGAPGMSGYCATKGAVRLFAKAVALEMAQLGDNIRVNSVHPGVIDTPIWTKVTPETRAAFGGAATGNAVDPAVLAAAMAPVGKAGVPEDIAWGVVYLASDEARYVTGSELVIDGGATAG